SHEEGTDRTPPRAQEASQRVAPLRAILRERAEGAGGGGEAGGASAVGVGQESAALDSKQSLKMAAPCGGVLPCARHGLGSFEDELGCYPAPLLCSPYRAGASIAAARR